MALPFTNKYTHTLQGKISPEVYPQVLEYISAFIEKKPAKDIVIEGNKLSFKPIWSFWNFKWNIMNMIDKGSFEIKALDGQTKLSYEILFYNIIIRAFFISILFFMTAEFIEVGVSLITSILIGIGSFIFLGGIFWLIYTLQHQNIFDKLTSEINDFIYQNNFTDTK